MTGAETPCQRTWRRRGRTAETSSRRHQSRCSSRGEKRTFRRLAERDRHDGKLEAEREQTIREICQGIAEDLADRFPQAASGPDVATPPLATVSTGRLVLCVPARDEADALAACMFAQVLNVQGIAAEAVSGEVLAGEISGRISKADTSLICVSALPPGAISHTRYLCKRLGRQFPRLTIVVGLWNVSGNLERMSARLTEAGADHIVTTFAAGAAEIERYARHFPDVPGGRIANAAGSAP